ncbi:MAG: hypothetical protein WCO86_03955 [Planctomycetota bacterium]
MKDSALPKRSARFKVGKEIGGAVYVHKQYESLLPESVQKAKLFLPPEFSYTVVKFKLSDETVSFIQSSDFDSADEPAVEDLYTIKTDGSVSFRRKLPDPWIYHHKWLFVSDDYTEFDVAASKQRSALWLSLNDVDKSRIGRKSYWEKHVLPRIPANSTDDLGDGTARES